MSATSTRARPAERISDEPGNWPATDTNIFGKMRGRYPTDEALAVRRGAAEDAAMKIIALGPGGAGAINAVLQRILKRRAPSVTWPNERIA